jgi:hypothetical protein
LALWPHHFSTHHFQSVRYSLLPSTWGSTTIGLLQCLPCAPCAHFHLNIVPITIALITG